MALLSLVVQLLLAVWFLHYPLQASCSPLLLHQIEELAPAAASAIRKRQDGFVSVTGITQFGVQPRLEIRELEKNADQWNIYLLGLARWQATDQRDKLSYYQVAGASTRVLDRIDLCAHKFERHTRSSVFSMGWSPTRQRYRLPRLLYSCLQCLSPLAPAIFGIV